MSGAGRKAAKGLLAKVLDRNNKTELSKHIRKVSYMERWATDKYHGTTAFGVVGKPAIPSKFGNKHEIERLKSKADFDFIHNKMTQFADKRVWGERLDKMVYVCHAFRSQVQGYSVVPVPLNMLDLREDIYYVWAVLKGASGALYVIQQNVYLYMMAQGACHWRACNSEVLIPSVIAFDKRDNFLGMIAQVKIEPDWLHLPDSWREENARYSQAAG